MVTTKTSPAEGEGRRQRRREQTKEKLFLAAMQLFARKGYPGTTVEEITQAADVGKGTFFNYFPSKDHVLSYLIERQIGVLERHLLLAREGNATNADVLMSLARELIRLPSSSPHMARAIISAFLGNAEVRERMVREFERGRTMIAEIIELETKRGKLRGKMNSSELARVFQRALMGTVLLWALDPAEPIEEQFQNTMRVFVSGVGAKPESRPAPGRKKAPREAR
jgi:AcrR family transcriptional regulator